MSRKYSCIHFKLRKEGSENLSQETLRNYSNIEGKLIDFGITEKDILEDAEKVITILDKKVENIRTRRSIFGFLGNVSTGEKTNEIYAKKSKDLGKLVQDKYDLNEGDKEHLELVNKRIDRIINGELSHINKRDNVNMILLALYMKYLNPGRREIGDLSFNPEDNNYLDFEKRQVVIGRCKTTKTNGIIIYDIPLEFIVKVKEVYKEHLNIDLDKQKPHTYFISSGKNFGKQNYYNLFKTIFPEITPTIWRRYFITNNSGDKNLKELKEMAHNMGHSFMTQQNYKIV